MTRTDLMAIVDALVAASGRPYVTAAVDKNKAFNRRQLMYAEKTRCLYEDDVALTLLIGQGTYDARSGSFAKRLCHIDHIAIEGIPLTNYQRRKGLVSIEELQANEFAYLSAENARPLRAAFVGGSTYRLWPAPDAVYNNCFAAGYALPADLPTDPSGDNLSLEFNEEDCEALAVYTAVGLVDWQSTSGTDYERMQYFSVPAARHMESMSKEVASQHAGPAVRGGAVTRMGASLG